MNAGMPTRSSTPHPSSCTFRRCTCAGIARIPTATFAIMKGTDIDLAAHFTVIAHAGIALYGAPVAEVFGAVPRAAYLDSILFDVENAVADIGSDPTHYTLNLCRVLAFVRDGLCLSKADGARWALRHLPEDGHSVISEAFACYTSNQTMHASTKALARSADFMLHLISEANTQPSALC